MDTDMKNITRYTYEFASFLGWRVAFCRHGRHLVRYFPDRRYGSKEASLHAAIELRDNVREVLKQLENLLENRFAKFLETAEQSKNNHCVKIDIGLSAVSKEHEEEGTSSSERKERGSSL